MTSRGPTADYEGKASEEVVTARPARLRSPNITAWPAFISTRVNLQISVTGRLGAFTRMASASGRLPHDWGFTGAAPTVAFNGTRRRPAYARA